MLKAKGADSEQFSKAVIWILIYTVWNKSLALSTGILKFYTLNKVTHKLKSYYVNFLICLEIFKSAGTFLSLKYLGLFYLPPDPFHCFFV